MIKRSSFVLFAVALVAAACTDTSNIPPPVELPPDPPGPTPPTATGAIQIVHASTNAPVVNVSVGGTAAQQGLDYKESRTPRSYVPGTYAVAIDAVLPDDGDDATTDLIEDVITADVTVAADTVYTIFAIGLAGTGATPPLAGTMTFERTGSISSATIAATVLHAAAGVGDVDVYVTTATGDIGTPADVVASLEDVSFGASAALTLLPGTYRVQITLANSAVVVYDSGPAALDGGVDPIVAAVDNTNAGSLSPVSLLIVGRGGVEEVQDVNTEAGIRVTHTISDLSANVDIVVSTDEAAEGEDQMLVEFDRIDDVAFTDVNPDQAMERYGDIPADDYVIQVFSTGTTTCLINCPVPATEETPAADPTETTLTEGVFYEAIAQGLTVPAEGETEADPPAALAYESDDPRPLATAAKLRVIHSSGSTGAVDVYVVDPATSDVTNETAVLTSVPFGANSGYLSLVPGTYRVIVTAAGETTAAIDTGATGIAFGAATTSTAIARDANTGESGPGLILLNDLTVAP